MTTLLKGAEVTKNLNSKLIEQAESLKQSGIFPTLAIVRVGEQPDQISYQKGATKRSDTVGVKVKSVVLKEGVTQSELLDQIESLNSDSSVHGILLLKPLPKHMDEDFISNSIVPQKDIDGITRLSLAGVFTNTDIGYPPCTPQACLEVLDYYNIDVTGKNITVIGRSLVVGKPVATMLCDRNATVTVCHTKTENLESIAKSSDILIASAGRAGLIGKEHLSSGQIVLDVGIHMGADGKLCGDVKFEEADGLVKAITPVPGGIGGVTTSVLLKNVLSATEKQAKL